jgi:hypothetical protein
MKQENYKEVPISAAKTIAENYDKQEIIVLAVDREFNKVHITTYETDKTFCKNAEIMGDFLAEVLQAKEPELYAELIEKCKVI